jgi:hypothetical protein
MVTTIAAFIALVISLFDLVMFLIYFGPLYRLIVTHETPKPNIHRKNGPQETIPRPKQQKPEVC